MLKIAKSRFSWNLQNVDITYTCVCMNSIWWVYQPAILLSAQTEYWKLIAKGTCRFQLSAHANFWKLIVQGRFQLSAQTKCRGLLWMQWRRSSDLQLQHCANCLPGRGMERGGGAEEGPTLCCGLLPPACLKNWWL